MLKLFWIIFICIFAVKCGIASDSIIISEAESTADSKSTTASESETSEFNEEECYEEDYSDSTTTNQTEPVTASNTTSTEPGSTEPSGEEECIGSDGYENALEKFDEGNVIFTNKFLYESAKLNPGVSIICSPYSVLFLLAQLAYYAAGITLQELLGVLNLGTKTSIRCLIPKYLDSVNSQKNVSFSLLENIYVSTQYTLTASFQRDAGNIFKAEVQTLDFCKPSQAAETINEWVANKTNNLIKDLISPDVLGCDTVLTLINAIYFKGDWQKPFDPENTMKEDFYVNKSTTVKVNMMSQTGYFNYADVNGTQVIELPYKGDNFSFVAWLPRDKDGIDDLIDEMGDPSFSLNNTLNSMSYTRVALSIPAFNTSTATDLKEMTMKANVKSLYDPDTCRLSGIIEENKPLYVSSAIQKATIIVDETGSEAAAANAIVISATAVLAEPPLVYLANHPFVYCIIFRGTPIFCGIFYGIFE